MSDFVLTNSGSVIDFRPMDKGSWALVYSQGSWVPWVGMPGDLLGSRPLSEKEAIKLTSPDIWLAESSKATLHLLVEGIRDTKIIVSMFNCYRYYSEIYKEKCDFKPRKIERSDIDRLLFEILCFAAFNIVVRAVSGYITRKFPAENHDSDSHNLRYFNQRLLEYLERFLNAHKIPAVRELAIGKTQRTPKKGLDEHLDPAKRIGDYLSAGSIEDELRLFSLRGGAAIDRRNVQVTEIIALSHTGMILDVISKTLKTVFEK